MTIQVGYLRRARLQTRRAGFGPRQKQIIFRLACVSEPAEGTHRLLSNAYWGSFP
jgi:hypothetical protein